MPTDAADTNAAEMKKTIAGLVHGIYSTGYKEA
jgi:hypothetical protein